MDSTLTQAPDVELDADKLAARAELIRRFSDTDLLTSLIQQAGREAVLDHKRNGVSVSTWQDGKLVIIQPEDIEVPEG
jgi:hypothetical protein